MVSSVRIVIVEDEVMIRSMLRLFCESEPSWHVVGEAGDCHGACSIVEAMRPDIVLLDLGLGSENGLDCLPHLLRLGARRVIVLTGNEDPTAHVQALAAGASTVLRKGDSPEKILRVIRNQAVAISAEKTLVAAPPENTTALPFEGQADIPCWHGGDLDDRQTALTSRELLIIELLAAGAKDADIADELQISLSTLHHSLSAIYHKLGVADRVELVVYAFRHQLAAPE